MITRVEQRIIRLERIGVDLERRTSNVLAKLGRVGQQLQGVRSGGFGLCSTTISGSVIGGDGGTVLPNSQVQIVGHTSGTDYGTVAAAAGTFSATLTLDPADTSVDLHVTGSGIRFTTGPAITRSITQCASNPLGSLQATPAAGYAYLTGSIRCLLPIATTLNWSITYIGSGTLTFGNSVCVSPITSQATGGGSPCPSVNTAVLVLFDVGIPGQIQYYGTGTGLGGDCPTPKSCPGGAGFFYNPLDPSWAALTSTSATCPTDPNSSTGFHHTRAYNAFSSNRIFPAGPVIMDFQE